MHESENVYALVISLMAGKVVEGSILLTMLGFSKAYSSTVDISHADLSSPFKPRYHWLRRYKLYMSTW